MTDRAPGDDDIPCTMCWAGVMGAKHTPSLEGPRLPPPGPQIEPAGRRPAWVATPAPNKRVPRGLPPSTPQQEYLPGQTSPECPAAPYTSGRCVRRFAGTRFSTAEPRRPDLVAAT